MFRKKRNMIVIILARLCWEYWSLTERWISFFLAQFKSQPTLISRALRRDKFTWRTCYHSWHPHAFILGDERERVASERGRRVRGRMSMKGGDFSISYSSRRRKCKRTVRYRWRKEEKEEKEAHHRCFSFLRIAPVKRSKKKCYTQTKWRKLMRSSKGISEQRCYLVKPDTLILQNKNVSDR